MYNRYIGHGGDGGDGGDGGGCYLCAVVGGPELSHLVPHRENVTLVGAAPPAILVLHPLELPALHDTGPDVSHHALRTFH